MYNKKLKEYCVGKPAKILIMRSLLGKKAFIESRQHPGGTYLCLIDKMQKFGRKGNLAWLKLSLEDTLELCYDIKIP